jgi:imidazolonepropionase-like amidohydrolase
MKTPTKTQALAVVGATIIDGTGGAPIKNGVIVTKGERIAAVGGAGTAIPPAPGGSKPRASSSSPAS